MVILSLFLSPSVPLFLSLPSPPLTVCQPPLVVLGDAFSFVMYSSCGGVRRCVVLAVSRGELTANGHILNVS